MNPALEALNRAATDLGSHEETSQIYKDLLYCCHAKKWVEQILRKAPFRSVAELLETSDEIEKSLNDEDWLQAFAGHPRIGRAKKPIKEWEAQEQQGTKNAADEILDKLETLNNLYFEKFGYIYIVCATGKSAQQMLEILESRINNDQKKEIKIAAAEQSQITKIRLYKLLDKLSQKNSRL